MRQAKTSEDKASAIVRALKARLPAEGRVAHGGPSCGYLPAGGAWAPPVVGHPASNFRIFGSGLDVVRRGGRAVTGRGACGAFPPRVATARELRSRGPGRPPSRASGPQTGASDRQARLAQPGAGVAPAEGGPAKRGPAREAPAERPQQRGPRAPQRGPREVPERRQRAPGRAQNHRNLHSFVRPDVPHFPDVKKRESIV